MPLAVVSAGLVSAAGLGESGSGVIPPGLTKVTFIHHEGRAPEVVVERGANGNGRPLSGQANSCTAGAGTDQCDSFIWDGQYWPGAAVTYNVNLAKSGDDGTFHGAIQAAADTWKDDLGSDFDLTFGGTTGRKASSLRNRMDGSSDVTWSALDRYQNPIAVTIFWSYTATGVVVEADLINNSNYDWATDGDASAFDVRTIDLHEFGHFLVLADLYDPSESALTMYGFGAPGAVDWFLGAGDKLGIATIYPPPAPPTTGSLSGVVTDSSDSSAIEGATVSLDGGPSTTTDATGAFSIPSVATGSYSVTASAPGYSPETTNSVSVNDGLNTVVNFSLTPQPAGSTVSVASIVYSTEGGKNGDKHLNIEVALDNPVSGASVSIDLYHDTLLVASSTAVTGGGGTVTFSLKNAEAGFYETEIFDVSAAGLT